mgnify:CR=1 FL=1
MRSDLDQRDSLTETGHVKQPVLMAPEVKRRHAHRPFVLQNQLLESAQAVSGQRQQTFVGDGKKGSLVFVRIAVVKDTVFISVHIFLDDGGTLGVP